jgi:hypothetical protein
MDAVTRLLGEVTKLQEEVDRFRSNCLRLAEYQRDLLKICSQWVSLRETHRETHRETPWRSDSLCLGLAV